MHPPPSFLPNVLSSPPPPLFPLSTRPKTSTQNGYERIETRGGYDFIEFGGGGGGMIKLKIKVGGGV